jgi:hypothetical protein
VSIAVPSRFEYKVRLDVRLQQAINGTNLGEPRLMIDNGSHNYATRGRRTIYEDAPASATPGSTLGAYTTTVVNAGAYEDLVFVWLELSEDTTGITWTAWTDKSDIQVQAYDEIAKTTTLDTSTDTGIVDGDELTGNLDLSARAGAFVRVDVRFKSGTATAADASLYSITIFEDDLTAAELPT